MSCTRHGCQQGTLAGARTRIGFVAIACSVTAIGAYAAGSARPVKVQTQQFDIHYQARPSRIPLTDVELWYTRDMGQTWHRFGSDTDRRSPFTFLATHEGLMGFLVILRNPFGASSDAPKRGIKGKSAV